MFKIFNILYLTMDEYVFHLYFHAIDTDHVDIILVYLWMDSIGTTNKKMQNKFVHF